MEPTEKRAFEFEALICEVSALNIEVMGMKTRNDVSKIRNEYPQYSEDEFLMCAEKMKEFAIKLRALKNSSL